MKANGIILSGRVTGCTLTADHKTSCSAHRLEQSRSVQVKFRIKVTQVRNYINVMMSIAGCTSSF